MDRWRGLVFDRVVMLGFAGRIWSVATGPVTLLLVAARFTPVEQGFYYTFFSLLAVSVFFELGLTQVVLQFAAHEWAALRLTPAGTLEGDAVARERLGALLRLGLRWFACAALAFLLALPVAGALLFGAREGADSLHWRWPWMLVCAVTALDLALIPAWSLLEGCGQVTAVYRYRLLRGLATTLVVWGSLLGGLGLWSAGLGVAAGTIVSLLELARRHGPVLRQLWAEGRGGAISWRAELAPLQARFALTFISNYLCGAVFTPILFAQRGPVEAGQLGLTLTISGALWSLAAIWAQARVPQFGTLAARRDWAALDRSTREAGLLAVGLASLGALAIWGGMLALARFAPDWAARLADPVTGGLLLAVAVMNCAVFVLGAYVRAHKREPMAGLAVVCGVLSVGAALLVAGPFGARGIAWSSVAVDALVTIPGAVLIVRRCRREWHAEPGAEPRATRQAAWRLGWRQTRAVLPSPP